MKKHEIISVSNNSIAQEMELQPGDFLLSINGQEITNLLDYRWLVAEESLLVEAQKPDGEIWELEIEKESGEDLGLTFARGSMGEDRRCVNACIFCFVEQQPPGLRQSLYIKDDDFYQSFTLGNYITLTNLSQGDIAQIIKHRLSPMRISVHAMDMALRQEMMGSPKAGELVGVLHRLANAGIEMHFQVVLCKGINDGEQLDYTIERLAELGKQARSLAVVPVGLTRHRDGLYPLEPFSPEDAARVITQVEGQQAKLRQERGGGFVFLADEWYVLAGRELPRHDTYEDFPQLDNGVGMMAHFKAEFLQGLTIGAAGSRLSLPQARAGIVTGNAAGKFMHSLTKQFSQAFPSISIEIYIIRNDFYGEGVTVSGLLTGCDIISQLKGRCKGLDVLFIPENAFRAGTEDMLCGTTLSEVAEALGVAVLKGSAHGGEFCRQLQMCTQND